jgi:hypothetical protein
MHKLFSMCLFVFITLYMFRAHSAHHQERQIVSIHPLVTVILTTPTGAMEALVGLPTLDLLIQGEARSAAHRLWSLGGWSYLHPRGHSCILTRLQKSDPIFNMSVDIMRPVYNLEPKYWVTMLRREEWTRSPRTPPAVKGLVWYTDGSRTAEGNGQGFMGNL